jgi:hypothetical protein
VNKEITQNPLSDLVRRLSTNRFETTAENWLTQNDYNVYRLGRMFRTLESQVEWTQGSPNADSGWMTIGSDAYEVLRDEQCPDSLVGLSKKLLYGKNASIVEWKQILAETNHPDSLKLMIPNVATVAKIIKSLRFELGLNTFNKSAFTKILAPTLNLLDAKSMNYRVNVLIPTSSTDHDGNVIAFQLHQSNGLRSSIVSFESVSKSTQFGVVMPIALPDMINH